MTVPKKEPMSRTSVQAARILAISVHLSRAWARSRVALVMMDTRTPEWDKWVAAGCDNLNIDHVVPEQI